MADAEEVKAYKGYLLTTKDNDESSWGGASLRDLVGDVFEKEEQVVFLFRKLDTATKAAKLWSKQYQTDVSIHKVYFSAIPEEELKDE